MWTPHWEPLTHPWWIGQGEAGHWIAYRILSSYLSQQASISLILDSLYLIVKPTNWPLFVTVFNFFFSKTNKNFIKALHNSFYYSKMYQFTKPTYSYFTLLHYLMILPPTGHPKYDDTGHFVQMANFFFDLNHSKSSMIMLWIGLTCTWHTWTASVYNYSLADINHTELLQGTNIRDTSNR